MQKSPASEKMNGSERNVANPREIYSKTQNGISGKKHGRISTWISAKHFGGSFKPLKIKIIPELVKESQKKLLDAFFW